MYEVKQMDTMKCKNCGNYIPHYGLLDGRLYRLYCGHCTVQRYKRKDPDRAACEMFIPGTSNEEAFVSKEYLSKKLLEKVLDMELLPEITDLPPAKINKRTKPSP